MAAVENRKARGCMTPCGQSLVVLRCYQTMTKATNVQGNHHISAPIPWEESNVSVGCPILKIQWFFLFNVPANHLHQNVLRGTPNCPLIRIMKHLCLRLYLNAQKGTIVQKIERLSPIQQVTRVIIIPAQTMHKNKGEILRTCSTC